MDDGFVKDIYFRSDKFLAPLVLAPNYLLIPRSEDILRETLALIDEIEVDLVNRELASVYRDIGGEG